MRIFLSGPMGAGKSTIGAALAKRLGCEFIDLDEEISKGAQGKTVAQIFEDEGEPGFREREARTLQAVINHGEASAVVALGGGTVLNSESRRAVSQAGFLITLYAPLATLKERVGTGERRPLLAKNAALDLQAILERRWPMYREAHAMIRTDDQSVDAVCTTIERHIRSHPVLVALGERSYLVRVGADIMDGLAGLIDEIQTGFSQSRPSSIVVVHDGDHKRPWAQKVIDVLNTTGIAVHVVHIPGTEADKTVHTVEKIWDQALGLGIDRNALLLAVGGGVVGDLVGFAASTLLRGVAFAQIPTTLLAMVDSSVGGKTGFNRSAGKNLVGTFYQPRFVLCDVDSLSTLPEAERLAGLAEVAKSAWLDGEESVRMLEENATALRVGEIEATIAAVRMSVALKARVVSQDEREGGARMQLNLGHTLGHAFEAAGNYKALRHGEAVALGIVAVAKLGVTLGETSDKDATRLIALLKSLGLPTDLKPWLKPDTLEYIESDKKRRGDNIHWVFPQNPGKFAVKPLSLSATQKALKAAFPDLL